MLRALDASADLDVMWGGRGDLDRLLDRDHAALLQGWATLHEQAGWLTWFEASYSIYGERGRIDLLVFHPATRILEVVEAKSDIWDTQETIGRLDVKVRLAGRVAAQREWVPSKIVPCLVLTDTRTTRRRIAEHVRLFAGFEVRGRSARAFVKAPHTGATGLLAFIPIQRAGRRAGQQRVRPPAVGGTRPATVSA